MFILESPFHITCKITAGCFLLHAVARALSVPWQSLMLCCKKMPKDNEDVPAGPIKVRVIFEMPSNMRDWPGSSTLAKLVKNETQDKTSMSEMCNSERYSYHDRAYMNDYQPNDELNVYIYEKDDGGIEQGHVEKIPIPVEKFQEALTPELMGADAKKHDVMVVCSVKIRYSACEFMREISATAQLIDKGAELYVPDSPLLEM